MSGINMSNNPNNSDKDLQNNTQNDKFVKISGSIGMVKMTSKDCNKNIFIFYDDHSNKNYCDEKESIFLFDLFEKVITENNNYIILLEEPFINNYSNIKFLWNDTPHIIKFRNYYKKIIKKCSDKKTCYVFPVDIRLIVSDVSVDELISNLDNPGYWEDYKIYAIEYFKYILYLFDFIKFDDKILNSTDNNNLIFIKRVFDNFNKTEYYTKLKEQANIFYNKFIEPNKTMWIFDFIKKYKDGFYSFSSGYPFENSNQDDFLDQYDKLISGMMEFYMFVLLTCFNTKNVIVYSGYYHSNNLAWVLEKIYGYKEVYKVGKTKDIEIALEEETIHNCLSIESGIFG